MGIFGEVGGAAGEGGTEAEVVVVVEPRIAVCEAQVGGVGEGVFEEVRDASMDTITRHLGGECKVDAMVVAGGDELLGEREGGLGFAAAHRSLDDDQRGRMDGSEEGLLNGVGLEMECVEKRGATQASAGPADMGEGGGGRLAGGVHGQAVGGGEEGFVGADPVGDGDESGEQPKGGIVAAVEFVGTTVGERAEDGDQLGGDGLAVGLHLGGARLGIEGFDGFALGFAVVRTDGDGPALTLGDAETLLEEELADIGVVGSGASHGSGLSDLTEREILEALGGEPSWAFGLKAEGDFADVVKGGERGGARG